MILKFIMDIFLSCLKRSLVRSTALRCKCALQITCGMKKQVWGIHRMLLLSLKTFVQNSKMTFSTKSIVEHSIVNQTCAVHGVEPCSVNSNSEVGVGKILVPPTPGRNVYSDRLRLRSPDSELGGARKILSESDLYVRTARHQMGLVSTDRVKLCHLFSQGVHAEAARAVTLLRLELAGGVTVVLSLSRYGRPLLPLGVQTRRAGRVLLVGRDRQQDDHAEWRPQSRAGHGHSDRHETEINRQL